MPDFTRKLTILSCLLFTGFCFWKAALGLVDGTDASVVSTAEAALIPSVSHQRGITTPIQDMRPGMRIVGRNPNRLETESTIDPTPEGWRLLSVRMLKQDGSYFEAELLRPLSWISRHRAQPGATIQLNMPELHVVGAAEVLSISDCPPIDAGDGPVVISTFKNVSNNVLNIYVEGEDTPIGVTVGHPIWSEDRQAFVHSEKLQIGEKLRSALGRTVRITSIEPRAGPEPVYNLEVAGEHVYSVTDAGLLVHNATQCNLTFDLDSLYTSTDILPSGRLISQFDTLQPLSSYSRKASNFAEGLQGSGTYPGLDRFRDITLTKGKVIFGGVPGQSEFYTTASAIKRADGSAEKLFQGLQVSPHPNFGYRPGVTAYEVIEDIPAAFGRTLANPQHGTGGLPQIVIENYTKYLRPIYSIPLK